MMMMMMMILIPLSNIASTNDLNNTNTTNFFLVPPCVVIVIVGDIPRVIEFMMYNPSALWYNVLTAITSTTGQIAIFYTIKRFGPVVFTIIMTTRQMMSIVLSTVLFGHQISAGNPPYQCTILSHTWNITWIWIIIRCRHSPN